MNILKFFIYTALILPLAGAAQKSAEKKSNVYIDMAKTTGMIRPLHGGNNGPISNLKVLDFTDFFKECKIPITRLHDVTWSNTYAVDISTIFRDFRADPSDPANYDFRRTDDYIAGIVNAGTKIIYRLGESIEWTKRKYDVNPPVDYQKWVDICLGIIRHYNEGWGDGFHYNIQYWEIWNEADCRSGNWTGTHEQYIDLYAAAAKGIKAKFPHLKVGGPAIGCSINSKDGVLKGNEFFHKFLSYCQKESIPLDFFSWHWYDVDPWKLASVPAFVRAQLDHYSFFKTESILGEWNYKPGGDWAGSSKIGQPRVDWYAEQNSVRGGAFLANVLMLLQDEPIDEANLYTVSNGEFGLFSDYGVLHKRTYAFKAFSALVNNTPVRVETRYAKQDSLVICAGTNQERTELAVLISNFSSAVKNLNLDMANNFLKGPLTYELYAVDDKNNFSKIRTNTLKSGNTFQITEKVASPSVLLLKLKMQK